MSTANSSHGLDRPLPSMVLYCLIWMASAPGEEAEYLVMHKQGADTFPCTKLRLRAKLYHALVRRMAEDLNLPGDSVYMEVELETLDRDEEAPHYKGFAKHWYLYPVDVALDAEGWKALDGRGSGLFDFKTLSQIGHAGAEPNISLICDYLQSQFADAMLHVTPSMEALACKWAAQNPEGLRVEPGQMIQDILDAGDRFLTCGRPIPTCPTKSKAWTVPGASSRPKTNRTFTCTACRRLRSTVSFEAA